jgi:hypothetical protein
MTSIYHSNKSGSLTNNFKTVIPLVIVGSIASTTYWVYLKWRQMVYQNHCLESYDFPIYNEYINADDSSEKIVVVLNEQLNLLKDQIHSQTHSLLEAYDKIDRLNKNLHQLLNDKKVVDNKLIEKTHINDILKQKVIDMEILIKSESDLTNINRQQNILHSPDILDLIQLPEVKMDTIDLDTPTDNTILMMANTT